MSPIKLSSHLVLSSLATAFLCGPFSLLSLSSHAEIAPEIATHIATKKQAVGKNWMAVTANKHATKAAENLLAQGGSAVDAAIAAQLVLGLVEPQSSGIGGGGFLLHWHAKNKELIHFNGRETAPSAVDEDHFLVEGQSMDFFDAVVGGHAVGTPGLLHALHSAHQKYGRLPWQKLFQPAIKLAEQGFLISPRLYALLGHMQNTPNGLKDPGMRAYFLTREGAVKAAGTRLTNAAYAKTLKIIANNGIEAFYNGEIAKRIVTAVQQNTLQVGTLSLGDLKSYRSQIQEAVCHTVNEYKLCGAPLPASGPITVMQILHFLDKTPGFYGLAADSPAFYHRLSEASKLAFADRNQYMADPDFIKVDQAALLNDNYLDQRASEIPLFGASKKKAVAGKLNDNNAFSYSESPELTSTTHLSIIDREGNIVSMTSSIEMAFGSQIMVDGFLLNNQLTDFSFTYQDKNKVKIANRIQAGKRPRSSMAPMISFHAKTELPLLVLGSPGGSRIIDYVAQIIAQQQLLGANLSDAVKSPHVVNMNGATEIEKNHPQSSSLGKTLEQLGHKVTYKQQTSGLHMIQLIKGEYIGVADPRREGSAKGE